MLAPPFLARFFRRTGLPLSWDTETNAVAGSSQETENANTEQHCAFGKEASLDLEELTKDVGPAATLVGLQRWAGTDVRKKSLEAYGRLTEANLLVTGVIASVLLRTHGLLLSD